MSELVGVAILLMAVTASDSATSLMHARTGKTLDELVPLLRARDVNRCR